MSPNGATGQSGTPNRLPWQKTDEQYWFFHWRQDGGQRPLEKVTGNVN